MAYFEWADDMAIDHGQIDAEHRKLVDLVNELHTATSQGMGHAVVGNLLNRLIADTAEHLHHEELEMQRAGFPDLDNHRIGHEHFVNDLRTLKQKLDAGSITVAAQLSSVLRDWLSIHIRRNDKELRRFMEAQSREARRKRAGGASSTGSNHENIKKIGR